VRVTKTTIPRRAATCVAVLSDVHGNATALAAVLDQLKRIDHDLVVFGGDLTWGPEPQETLALVRAMTVPATFIRGNADRAVLENAARIEQGETHELRPRELWLADLHSAEDVAFLATFAEQAVVRVAGIGDVRFCPGSPRGDEELITSATPAERITVLMSGIKERVLVSAHTHLQFDRQVAGVRSINPGSVGMPYMGRPGAYWALIGPRVELHCSDYDLELARSAYLATEDPLREAMVELLLTPPTPDEMIADAEQRVFAG